MKKLLLIMILLVPNLVLAATCPAADKADLLTQSNTLKVNYEEIIREENIGGEDIKFYLLQINFLNLTSDMYVEVTNNVNSDKFFITSADLVDYVYNFEHQDLSEIYTYIFSVYGSSDTNCEDELLSVQRLTVPMYNKYSSLERCIGYSEESVCQTFTTTSGLTQAYVLEKLNNLTEEAATEIEKQEEKLNLENFNFNYLIIGGICVIAFAIIVVVVKKRRSDLK